MKKYYLFLVSFFCLCTLTAQHESHEMNVENVKGKPADSVGVPMSHAFSLNLPMNRNGSGTGWLPDASPMYGYMIHGEKWMYMLHGNVFIRYTNQDVSSKGTRGDSKIDAPNWVMAMGQRRVGKSGLLRFSGMFSLDPIFGGDGYPLLFQTGETYQGQPLVDRQHPHNLFSELSIAYTESFTQDFDIFAYLAYPGEPALGPVAFMHRPSSLNNPDSPLGHHWQDATHITFGVVTLGMRYKIFKLDGSIFTGREPGEARYGFDEPRFDSYSYRLAANPHPQWSLQVSQAFLRSPEPLEPEEDVWRSTASVLYSLPIVGEDASLTSALIWGYNDAGEDHKEHSITLETNLQKERLALYGRYEWVQKSAEELLLEAQFGEQIFDINALTIGTNYRLLNYCDTNFTAGVQGSVYMTGPLLEPVYGKNPFSFEIYLKISPGIMKVDRPGEHKEMDMIQH